MKVIIDRFEEDIAVVELNGEMLHAPRALFAEAGEGDAVELTVLPRRTDQSRDDVAEKLMELRRATHERFPSDSKNCEDTEEDHPAALFAKLRRKKKRK